MPMVAWADEQADKDLSLIVTARRVAEPAQGVPISIATLDDSALARMGAVTLSDIARAVPNLTIARASVLGAEQPTIRGVFSPIGASTVGLYIDDVPIETRSLEVAGNADLRTFDLERVEILRGPQGTLFGASSLGGTIRLITHQPDLTRTDGYMTGQVGQVTHGGISAGVQGAVGMPILPDRLALRIGGYYRRDAGYVDRVDRTTGAVIDRNIDHVSAFAIRASVKAALGAHVILTPTILYQKSERGDLSFQDSGLGDYRQGAIIRQPGRDSMLLPSLTAQVDLGGATVTSVTAYLRHDNDQVTDYSTVFGELVLGASVPGLTVPGGSRSATHVGQRGFGQEVRITSSQTADLRWVIGGYYHWSRFSLGQSVREPGIEELTERFLDAPVEQVFGAPLLPGGVSFASYQRIVAKELAGFGQLGWRFADGWEATAGLRVTRSVLRLEESAAGPYAGSASGSGERRKDRDLPVTPSFTLSYRPGENSLIYASASKGFRVGGSNAPVPEGACAADLKAVGQDGAPPDYDADSLWNYEAGVKASLPRHGLQMSLAAFQIDWRHIQQSVVLPNCGFAFIDNLGAARNRGFELDIGGRPIPALQINGAVGFVDAKFRKTIAGGFGAPIVEKGDAMPYVPRWSFRLSANYALPLRDGVQAYVAPEYQREGRYKRAPSVRAVAYDARVYDGAGYDMVLVRAGVRSARWDISIAVINLLNDRSTLFRNVDLVPISGTPERLLTPRPRTFELAGTLRF